LNIDKAEIKTDNRLADFSDEKVQIKCARCEVRSAALWDSSPNQTHRPSPCSFIIANRAGEQGAERLKAETNLW